MASLYDKAITVFASHAQEVVHKESMAVTAHGLYVVTSIEKKSVEKLQVHSWLYPHYKTISPSKIMQSLYSY